MTSDKSAPTVRPVLDLVGGAEVAQLLGVSRQRVHEIVRTAADFPEPVAELAAGRIWQRSDVEAWMAARDRQRKGTVMEEVSGVALVSATSFADMQAVGDTVREARPVVVELRRLDLVQMRRCIDFLSGAGYVVGGEVERIAEQAYLVSPEGVSITAKQRKAITDRLE